MSDLTDTPAQAFDRRPDLWNFVLVAFLSAVFTICSLSFIYFGQTDRLDTAIHEQRESQDISACRASYASAVTDATTDYLLALGRVALSTPRSTERQEARIQALAAGERLQDATDARSKFEDGPSGEC